MVFEIKADAVVERNELDRHAKPRPELSKVKPIGPPVPQGSPTEKSDVIATYTVGSYSPRRAFRNLRSIILLSQEITLYPVVQLDHQGIEAGLLLERIRTAA